MVVVLSLVVEENLIINNLAQKGVVNYRYYSMRNTANNFLSKALDLIQSNTLQTNRIFFESIDLDKDFSLLRSFQKMLGVGRLPSYSMGSLTRLADKSDSQSSVKSILSTD